MSDATTLQPPGNETLESVGGAYEDWAKRWAAFLAQVKDAARSGSVDEVLRDKATIGNSERRLAGSHEDREILELLQNARDAISEEAEEAGRVFVGVYDDGIMVANTGDRFDFEDDRVEDALTMIGRTGKDDDDDSIGHKGVGLKSVLASGDAFEIYTRPDAGSNEVRGVRLSRRYLLGAILHRLGKEVELDEMIQGVHPLIRKAIEPDDAPPQDVELNGEIRQHLSELPLFNFPVPIDLANEPMNPAVERLLKKNTSSDCKQPFRTAVFIRYEDEDWCELLQQWDIDEPGERDRTGAPGAERANRHWNYVSQTANSNGGLQIETVVQLGKIDELILEGGIHSNSSAAGIQDRHRERWCIQRTEGMTSPDGELSHRVVEVTIEAATADLNYEELRRDIFDQFEAGEDEITDVRILVPRDVDKPRDYPLYLFYPIENTDSTPLPFCLHGRFRVGTNRKELSSSRLSRNQKVLEEAIRLLVCVARAVATSDKNIGISREQYPWVLLPPCRESMVKRVENPQTPRQLLRWFCEHLYDELKETECVRVVESGSRAVVPGESMLHWGEAPRKALEALQTIADTTENVAIDSNASNRPLPSRASLEALAKLPRDWSERVEKLLLKNKSQDEFSEQLTRDWAKQLSTALTASDELAIRADASAARALLRGTARLIEASTDVDERKEFIEELSDSLQGVHLLPCRIDEANNGDNLKLVKIENVPEPEQGSQKLQSRSVIWNVEREEALPSPPSAAGFTVFLLDDEIEKKSEVRTILDVSGRPWGIRKYESLPDYFRLLLNGFAFGDQQIISSVEFAFLAARLGELAQGADDLGVGVGAYITDKMLQQAIKKDGQYRRDLRRRLQLRRCSVDLPDVDQSPVRDFAMGDEWQEALRRVGAEDESGEPGELEPYRELVYPAPEWPAPASREWTEFFAENGAERIDTADIAATLSLFGTGPLPGIRVICMYGPEHPDFQNNSPEWNPAKWFGASQENRPESVEALVETLDNYRTYEDMITSAGFHPADTANHSSCCPVKLQRVSKNINLASWVWIDDPNRLASFGGQLWEILERHIDQLNPSLLTTGWTCKNGEKRRRLWKKTIPTLLNWQLRQLTVWSSVVEVDEKVEEEWGQDAQQLHYAVIATDGRGAQASRLFPSVSLGSEDGPSGELLSTLGVKRINELNATEAELRLQKVMEVLAVEEELGDCSVELNIPSKREQDWNQAYSELLRPIIEHWSDATNSSGEVDWTFLTHLPLVKFKAGSRNWVAVPLKEIGRTDGVQVDGVQVRTFDSRSPKPWETQEVRDEDYYVFRRPRSGGAFARFASAVGAQKLDAAKPVFSSEELDRQSERYADRIDDIRAVIGERAELILAAIESTDDDRIKGAREELEQARDKLAVASMFPGRHEDRESGLYRIGEGPPAFVLNAGAVEPGDDLSASMLAWGVALLFERPKSVATFREALDENTAREKLDERWVRRSFPLEQVSRILGTHKERELKGKLDALEELADSFGLNVGGVGIDATSADELLELVAPTFKGELAFVPDLLFGASSSRNDWLRKLEETSFSNEEAEEKLIRWLADKEKYLVGPLLDHSQRRRSENLLRLVRAHETIGQDRLAKHEHWQAQLDELREADEALAPEQKLPRKLREITEVSRWCYLAVENRLETRIDQFIQSIEGLSSEMCELLQAYVKHGSFPVETGGNSSKTRRATAFRQMSRAISEDPALVDEISQFNSKRVVDSDSLEVRKSAKSSNRQGGSSQMTGRGEQAEVFVMLSILNRVANWMEASPDRCELLRQGFCKLYRSQQNADYDWHVQNMWDSGLRDLIKDNRFPNHAEFIDWKSRLSSSDMPVSADPLLRLINVAIEQGPGFDVIDPLGALKRGVDPSAEQLSFTPVEVKAVSGSEPPYDFRLTTNEYRMCKEFVRDGHDYVIRLVEVPSPDSIDWLSECKIAREIVISSVQQADDFMARRDPAVVIKGGYMNLRLE